MLVFKSRHDQAKEEDYQMELRGQIGGGNTFQRGTLEANY